VSVGIVPMSETTPIKQVNIVLHLSLSTTYSRLGWGEYSSLNEITLLGNNKPRIGRRSSRCVGTILSGKLTCLGLVGGGVICVRQIFLRDYKRYMHIAMSKSSCCRALGCPRWHRRFRTQRTHCQQTHTKQVLRR
jgi:hypothetical protein